MNKITDDILSNFLHNYDLMQDFLTTDKYGFFELHPDITQYEYINTCFQCLDRLGLITTTYKPIGLVDGTYIRKACKKRGLDEFYLLTLCS